MEYKEVLQAKIELIEDILCTSEYRLGSTVRIDLTEIQSSYKEELDSAISINNEIEKAFNAGRAGINCTPTGDDEFEMNVDRERDSWECRKYETFYDYLKTIKKE